MLMLYLLQTIVPLILIGWFVFAPPRSSAGVWSQALAIGLGLVAIAITGIWAFPPWWTPYFFGALLCASVIRNLVAKRTRSLWPGHVSGWLSLGLFVCLGLYSADDARAALVARAKPAGHSIDLASPLGPGSYLVANGGAAPSINAHAPLLDQSVARHRPYWGTALGVDLVALDRWGFRADAIMPADPSRYVIWGRPVIAPCAGEVIVAVDGLPDMEVPQADRDHLAGNHVILRCAGADVLLGHFRRGSVIVRVGERVAIGEPMARAGNSGNTSEPHLHINAQEPGTQAQPFSGAPIPIRIEGRYLVRNDRINVPMRDRHGVSAP